MTQTTKTISFTQELDTQLDTLVDFLNKNKIDGAISKSKIIRIAVSEYLEKQKKIQKILKEHSENKREIKNEQPIRA
jgi:metal-responsive CopG/Arc/MetJ family transcriptional regulator